MLWQSLSRHLVSSGSHTPKENLRPQRGLQSMPTPCNDVSYIEAGVLYPVPNHCGGFLGKCQCVQWVGAQLKCFVPVKYSLIRLCCSRTQWHSVCMRLTSFSEEQNISHADKSMAEIIATAPVCYPHHLCLLLLHYKASVSCGLKTERFSCPDLCMVSSVVTWMWPAL